MLGFMDDGRGAPPGLAGSMEMLRRLIAFQTVSRESNLALIDFVREHLRECDARARLTFDDSRRKANLFATLGPPAPGGIVLSGHTDVVPVDGQAWASDPFDLIDRDGRLYGRGTADMKSFIAVALALSPGYVARLERPLHLALSYDEEVGCLGIGRLIADLVESGVRPEGCIVGEPTMMTPVIGHKGKMSYRCTVRGRAAHSAYAPRAVNAVEAAAEAIAYLKRMSRRHRDGGPYDHAYDVPYTTVHTGVIRGGSALNIVPHECIFDFEFRHLPADDPHALLAEFNAYLHAELEREMHAVDAQTGFSIEQLSAIPALDTPAETPIVALAQELTGRYELAKVSYGTEASQFQHSGIPTVVCGPGSIEQAHKPDEYIDRAQLAACERFVRALLERLCRGAGE
jgi:acetylornithine deacetylase